MSNIIHIPFHYTPHINHFIYNFLQNKRTHFLKNECAYPSTIQCLTVDQLKQQFTLAKYSINTYTKGKKNGMLEYDSKSITIKDPEILNHQL